MKTPAGEVATATDLGFTPFKEQWDELEVEDGTRIRLRTIVTEVLRLDEVRDDEGNPVFMIQTQTIVRIDPPSPRPASRP